MIDDEAQKTKWFTLVQEWIASDLSIQSFLKQHAVTHSTFYRWRMRYAQEHLVRPSVSEISRTFVEARFTSAPDIAASLCLEHPSGWRLQFASNTHPDLITSIAKGLVCN